MSSEWFCPVCGSQARTGVQYRLSTEDYDGVSEWRCNGCTQRTGRWSRRVLQDGEIEGRYGRLSPTPPREGVVR